MTWEQDFARLRRLAPTAGRIDVIDERMTGQLIIRLENASDEDAGRACAPALPYA